MNVYIGLILFLCLLAVVSRFLDNKSEKLLYFLGCAVILFLTIFRHISVGPDTETYCAEFLRVRNQVPWPELAGTGWEPGYVFLNKVIGIFFSTGQGLIIALGILILIPVFIWIRKYSDLPCMSLVVYVGAGFWGWSSIYRQWCAIAILLYSLKYVKSRQLTRFVLTVAIAMLFHRTAAVFLAVYFVYNIRITRRMMVYSIAGSMVLGGMGPLLLSILNRFARIPESENFNGGFSMLFVLWLVVLFVFGKARKQLADPDFKLTFSMLWIAATIQPVAFTFSNWARIVQYFSLALVLVLPNSVYRLSRGQGKRSIFLWNMGMGLLMIGWYLISGMEGEYLFMWQG